MINLSELMPVKLADIELRDLFAMFANDWDIKSFISDDCWRDPKAKFAAKYQYADEMLKARNKKP